MIAVGFHHHIQCGFGVSAARLRASVPSPPHPVQKSFSRRRQAVNLSSIIATLKNQRLKTRIDSDSFPFPPQLREADTRERFRASTSNAEGQKTVEKLEDTSATSAQELREISTVVDWTAVFLPFLFPALGGLLFGYDIGATSGAVLSMKDAALSGTDWFDLSATATGLVVSGSLAGALVGSGLAFLVGDILGRRKELILAAVLYGGGATLMALAPNLAALLAGRLLYGLAIGLAMHAAPMYIAETAPSTVRGTLISLKEMFIVGGILLGYLAGSAEISQVGGWRIMYGAAAPIALAMAAGSWWLPPSPRWLLLSASQQHPMSELRGDATTAARGALWRLRGKGASEDKVEQELQDMVNGVEEGAEGPQGLQELLTGGNLRALGIGVGLVFFQQVTGQPSVLYYAAPILQDAGFADASDATKVAVLLGSFKLLMTGVAVLSVDRWGRRPLLLTGVSGLVLSLFLLALYYWSGSALPALSVGALLLYVGCYQVSFGPVSWLMVSEVFPLNVRGRALSIATLVNFASNALVSFALPSIQASLGQTGTFSTFGVIGLMSLVFIFFRVPETKGLSLEEIEVKLQNES